jgi:hypothetical protein
MERGMLLNEEQYMQARQEHGDDFEAAMGAEPSTTCCARSTCSRK